MGQCLSTGQIQRIDDIVLRTDDGSDRFLGITVYPIDTGARETAQLLLFGADVTGRRIMERQLGEAQKLEAIGQLAAGVAHEINTPVQYVADNLRFLSDAYRDCTELFLARARRSL